jgi:hypothetical protein
MDGEKGEGGVGKKGWREGGWSLIGLHRRGFGLDAIILLFHHKVHGGGGGKAGKFLLINHLKLWIIMQSSPRNVSQMNARLPLFHW